jgi:hypothetical protein
MYVCANDTSRIMFASKKLFYCRWHLMYLALQSGSPLKSVPKPFLAAI